MNTTKGSRFLSSATVRTLTARGFSIVGTAAQRGDVWISRRRAGGWIVTNRPVLRVEEAALPITGMGADTLEEALRLADALDVVAPLVEAPAAVAVEATEEPGPDLIPLDSVEKPAGGPARAFGPRDEPCIICGRPINTARTARYAHLLTSGHLAPIGLEHEDSQGYHAIGSDCARRLPASHSKEFPPFH